MQTEQLPPSNLTFLIDVSGSMQSPDKLPLLKQSFHMLVDQLTPRDRVAIVVYAGSAGEVLPSTPVSDRQKIHDAIDELEAGGSTAGAEGINGAYDIAQANFIRGGNNRVILATDGDFNVGVVNFEALVDMAERQRTTGVALTTLGSSYYHLAPDNARLVWDRLPMAVGFMGLLTALFAERVSLTAAKWLFVPLLAAGAASVGYWHWSELQNAGDLRPYLLVQFGSLLVVVLLLVLYPARYPGTGYLVAGLAAYAAAKGLEVADRPIFALGHMVSGHTLKHLAAAGGVARLAAMLRARRP